MQKKIATSPDAPPDTEHPSALETASVSVVVLDESGLHARPAARLARAAQAFSADITVEHEGVFADAKSILDVLSLAAGRGAALTLHCRGEDALHAAQSLHELFSGPFQERE